MVRPLPLSPVSTTRSDPFNVILYQQTVSPSERVHSKIKIPQRLASPLPKYVVSSETVQPRRLYVTLWTVYRVSNLVQVLTEVHNCRCSLLQDTQLQVFYSMLDQRLHGSQTLHTPLPEILSQTQAQFLGIDHIADTVRCPSPPTLSASWFPLSVFTIFQILALTSSRWPIFELICGLMTHSVCLPVLLHTSLTHADDKWGAAFSFAVVALAFWPLGWLRSEIFLLPDVSGHSRSDMVRVLP